ncbi:MAG: lysyl-tRNA synthetase [Rhizorhabdus sp.]|nr:lysyl-tRNA synthetase [Rhizorhabdus sp.]
MPSSVIAAFDYDEPARRLNVRFVSGRRYAYHDVPPDVATAMRAAASKGSFFNAEIKDRYRFTKQR